MRRVILIGILVLSASLASGCFSPTGIVAPVANNPQIIHGDLLIPSGGSILAIAFDDESIETISPEAEEEFRLGLDTLSRYGQYNDSLAFFDAALARDRNFTAAWLAKGVALHNLHRYDDAIACYDRALVLSPRDPTIWNLKAVTLTDAGRADEAEKLQRLAAETDVSDSRG